MRIGGYFFGEILYKVLRLKINTYVYDVHDISLRRRNGDVDLNTILRRVAPDHGGTGGGHPFAAGARIPEKELEAFLFNLDEAIGT
jgi:nanoRNase/pAp phosphatase (c-di-AMP/oligoRNAs hydrolase)